MAEGGYETLLRQLEERQDIGKAIKGLFPPYFPGSSLPDEYQRWISVGLRAVRNETRVVSR